MPKEDEKAEVETPEKDAAKAGSETTESAEKALNVTSVSDAKEKVSDIEVVGDGDLWKLLCKASSKAQGWMKSTKAMNVRRGVLVQVTTQQRNEDGTYALAESVGYVPDMKVGPVKEDGGRSLERL